MTLRGVLFVCGLLAVAPSLRAAEPAPDDDPRVASAVELARG